MKKMEKAFVLMNILSELSVLLAQSRLSLFYMFFFQFLIGKNVNNSSHLFKNFLQFILIYF